MILVDGQNRIFSVSSYFSPEGIESPSARIAYWLRATAMFGKQFANLPFSFFEKWVECYASVLHHVWHWPKRIRVTSSSQVVQFSARRGQNRCGGAQVDNNTSRQLPILFCWSTSQHCDWRHRGHASVLIRTCLAHFVPVGMRRRWLPVFFLKNSTKLQPFESHFFRRLGGLSWPLECRPIFLHLCFPFFFLGCDHISLPKCRRQGPNDKPNWSNRREKHVKYRWGRFLKSWKWK